MRLPILSVTDNVTNVIIETPVNLTAMGVSPGFNMVTIYEQVFDLFNDSLDDLLNMIVYQPQDYLTWQLDRFQP